MSRDEPAHARDRDPRAAVHELRTAAPVLWPAVVSGGLLGGFFALVAVAMLVRGSVLAGLFVGGFGAMFLWPVVSSVRRPRIVVARSGVAVRGAHERALGWDEIEGLGAVRTNALGVGELTTFYVYTREGDDVVFTSAWPGYEPVAASIQARRFDPGATLDVDRALRDPPRGDPAAALGMDPSALARFAREVRVALRALGVEARVSEKRLRAETVDGGAFELFAIGRRCAPEREALWPKVLRAHFERVLSARAAAAKVLASDATLESVRDRLTLQVFPARDGEGGVSEPLGATGLVRVVVADVGEAEVTIEAARVEAWGATREEVLAIARASLARGAAPARTALKGSPAMAFRGERVAARVTELGAWTELDPRFGALVGIPSQDAIVALPLRNAADLLFLSMGSFGSATEAIHREDPKPLSERVFWMRGDELIEVPFVVTHQGPTWIVPDALSGALVGRDTGGGAGGSTESRGAS